MMSQLSLLIFILLSTFRNRKFFPFDSKIKMPALQAKQGLLANARDPRVRGSNKADDVAAIAAYFYFAVFLQEPQVLSVRQQNKNARLAGGPSSAL
jgi:hypothetical protein